MIHHPGCDRPDVQQDVTSLASGELSVASRCRTCGATQRTIMDRDDYDDPDGAA